MSIGASGSNLDYLRVDGVAYLFWFAVGSSAGAELALRRGNQFLDRVQIGLRRLSVKPMQMPF